MVVACSLGRIKDGDSATRTLSVKYATRGAKQALFAVAGELTDPNSNNNQAAATTSVDPIPCHPASTLSRVTGPGVEDQPSVGGAFTIQAVDAQGANVTCGGTPFSASVFHGYTTSIPLTDNGDGTYSGRYNNGYAGEYTVSILVNGAPIAGSPFVITRPGVAASKTRAYGPGLEGGAVGTVAEFFVELNQIDGQRYTEPDAPIGVDITDPNGNIVPVEKSTVEPGRLRYTYQPQLVGTYQVDVVVRNTQDPNQSQPVPGSPFSVPIQCPASTLSRVTGPGVEDQPSVGGAFTIQAVDAQGANVTCGGTPFSASVFHGYTTSIPLTDNGDGTYSGRYNNGYAGEYTVSILVNGAPIAGSPFVITRPGVAASKTRAYGPGLEGGAVGTVAEFFVELNQIDGQRYTEPDAPIGVDITDPNGNIVPVEKSTVEPGRLRYTYQPQLVGTYQVDVVVRNTQDPNQSQPVPGSPFSVPIASAP